MKSDPFPKIKNKFYSFKKSKKVYNNGIKNNQKLLFGLRKEKYPKIKQFKYLFKILSVKEKRLILSLMAMIIGSACFIGFIFSSGHITIVPANTGEYAEGMVGYPQFINPIYAQVSDIDNDLSSLIFSGLLKYDKDLKLVPDLALSYEINADQKEYTFYLRKDVLWHNGTHFFADDVIFTIDAIKKFSEYKKSPLYAAFKYIEVIRIDDYAVKFILPEPYAPFLNILTFGIIPENIWIEVPAQNATLAKYNIKPVGTGIYKFNSLTKDSIGNIKSYTLIRNDEYYGKKPYIEKITFKFYPDFESASMAVKGKEIQGISFLPKEFRQDIKDNKNYEIRSLNLPQYTTVFFNQEHNEILKNKNIRMALTQAINKKELLDEALSEEGILIDGPILPGFIGYNPKLQKYDYNPQEANKLLDDLDWDKISSEDFIKSEKEKIEKMIVEKEDKIKEDEEEEEADSTDGEDKEENKEEKDAINKEIEELKQKMADIEKYNEQNFYRKKDDAILSIFLTTVNNEDNIKIINEIKEYWKDIGVFAELKIVESQDIENDVLKNRDYDCLVYGEIIGSDPDPYPFWHSSQNKYPGLNLAIFSNEEVDKLLEDARQTIDLQKRKDKYIHFQNILVQELPAIFLYSPTYSYILNSKIKGFDVSKIFLPCDRFSNITDWYIETKRAWR